MNLNANPKQDFLDDQEKGTDLKIRLERTGTTHLIWGCLEPRAAFRRRFPVLVVGQIWAALRSLGLEVSGTAPGDTVPKHIYSLPDLLHRFPSEMLRMPALSEHRASQLCPTRQPQLPELQDARTPAPGGALQGLGSPPVLGLSH